MPDLLIRNIGLLATPVYSERDNLTREIFQISGAAILIKDGRIAEIGSDAELSESVPRGFDTLDARGNLVLPGLIDCHTHPVFVGNRAAEFHLRNAGKSYLEIAAAGGGIQSSARAVHKASVEQIVSESLPRFFRALSCGTTTLECKSGYGLDWTGEEKLLLALQTIGKIVPQRLHKTFLIHGIPEDLKSKRAKYADQVLQEMIPSVVARNLATAADVFCEEGAFTVEESRRFLETARKNGLQISVHANQFGHSGGAKLAAELGARSADHLEFLNDGEMAALARANTVGVILPASVFFLGSTDYPPARKMIEKGMRVAVATDMNPGSSMTESLPFCLTAAASYCRMNAAELLWSVTLDAARVLGVDREIGSIEVGKFADLSFWQLPDFDSLSYYFGTTRAACVLINGRKVFENGDAAGGY